MRLRLLNLLGQLAPVAFNTNISKIFSCKLYAVVAIITNLLTW